jgi:hypothetical protein
MLFWGVHEVCSPIPVLTRPPSTSGDAATDLPPRVDDFVEPRLVDVPGLIQDIAVTLIEIGPARVH